MVLLLPTDPRHPLPPPGTGTGASLEPANSALGLGPRTCQWVTFRLGRATDWRIQEPNCKGDKIGSCLNWNWDWSHWKPDCDARRRRAANLAPAATGAASNGTLVISYHRQQVR
ncbi:uncharacterized protein HMPREF1120_08314 [Exophiala dermatitidis NIH/UT8656]|uniref:Uncharacterized protein n=1 Tax=Exophiala dermatitidis (strain ATCC 34100 / CBS 525.76 / NIH/UT8656) TaxID=858893 RepID=H6C8C1_EXODN|nr:uncharacterized protein HMPREF1120_08314 [Exophiala dermatitidis NIH/UT8656]EHY60348.1 hypothetical protein HMPREF1120_08314 [Exophiala dermatitidis NIH/UT8656]